MEMGGKKERANTSKHCAMSVMGKSKIRNHKNKTNYIRSLISIFRLIGPKNDLSRCALRLSILPFGEVLDCGQKRSGDSGGVAGCWYSRGYIYWVGEVAGYIIT
jgi:hypothetical protein